MGKPVESLFEGGQRRKIKDEEASRVHGVTAAAGLDFYSLFLSVSKFGISSKSKGISGSAERMNVSVSSAVRQRLGGIMFCVTCGGGRLR
jgi:hypothetical protein